RNRPPPSRLAGRYRPHLRTGHAAPVRHATCAQRLPGPAPCNAALRRASWAHQSNTPVRTTRPMEQQGAESRRITLHAPEDFEGMRRAGRLAAETLDMIVPYVRPGVTTGELDRLCHEFIVSHGAVPAPLGYRGFPKSICTSVNHVVCHGIPGDRV